MKQRICALLTGCGLLAGVIAGGTGCSTGSGSFSRKIDDTVWSVEAVINQKGDSESLPGDLAFYFFTPEWDQLAETFSLWGW